MRLSLNWAIPMVAIASLLGTGHRTGHHCCLLLPQAAHTAKDSHIEQHFVTLGEPHNILSENQMDSVTERAAGQAPEECS